MARTPVYAYDKTGKAISGAYIENGRTYFGNGTPISKGTKVVDNSGREWVKTSGGGELTGVNYGLQGNERDIGGRKIGSTGAITASDYYDKMLQEQQRAIQARIDQAVEANNAYIPQIQNQSKQALQNAYIANQQARMRAPQALNALGMTGGASESSLLGLDTNYQNARSQIEQERSRALEGIRQNEAQIRATGDAALSEAAASYYDKLVAAALEAERQAQDQANWEAEFALEQKQYEDAAAQAAWLRDFEEKTLKYNQSKSSGSGGMTKDESYAADYMQVAGGTMSPAMIEANAQALIAQYGVSKFNQLLKLAQNSYKTPMTNQGMAVNWWER